MRYLKITIFLFFALFLGVAPSLAKSNVNYSRDKIDIIYFYGENCPHCKNIEPLIQKVEDEYEKEIKIHRLEVSQSKDLFFEYLAAYGSPFEKVFTPVIFINDQVLLGEDEIRDNLDNFVKTCLDKGEECLLKLEKDNEPSLKKEFSLSLPIIVSSALIDSLNPCAIGVLLFLIALMAGLKETRGRILKIGLIYIAAVFLTYYLAGLGLRAFFIGLGISRLIIWIGALLLVVMGTADVWSYFKNDSPVCKAGSRRDRIVNRFFKKGAVATVFIGGILVSLFELPCTGAVYLAVLGLMSQEGNTLLGNLYLILYNLIFVLPLIFILFLGALGFSNEILKKLKPENQKKLRLVTGALMVLIAFLLLILV